jgi:hypothetical protein
MDIRRRRPLSPRSSHLTLCRKRLGRDSIIHLMNPQISKGNQLAMLLVPRNTRITGHLPRRTNQASTADLFRMVREPIIARKYNRSVRSLRRA